LNARELPSHSINDNLTKDGKVIKCEWHNTVLKDKEGKTIVISMVQDITEREKVKERLWKEHSLLQTLMDNIPDCIYFKDDKNRFIRVNKAKAEHSNTIPDEMIGKTDFDFLPEEEARETFADDNRVMKSGKPIIDKVEKITHLNEKEHWISATKVPWYNDKGQIVGTMGISRDITERKEEQDQIENLGRLHRLLGRSINRSKTIKQLSSTVLTGLFNYRYFYQRLQEQKDRLKRYAEVYSLLYIDIDNFKKCNDTYGHLEGDRVLKILSRILKDNLRKTDSAYRVRGEEFAVLLPHTSKEKAKKVAERIQREVRDKLYPQYKITVSIGVANSKDDEDVVRKADEAKRKGKDRIWVASEDTSLKT